MFPAIWKEVSKDQGSETQISKVKSHKRHVVDQDLSGWTDSSPQNPLNPDLGYHAEAIQSPALCQEPEARSRDTGSSVYLWARQVSFHSRCTVDSLIASHPLFRARMGCLSTGWPSGWLPSNFSSTAGRTWDWVGPLKTALALRGAGSAMGGCYRH